MSKDEINRMETPPICPWCKSADKAVRLEVSGFRMGCYNDWHIPACKNCGKGAYSHGHEFGCQRYQAERAA